MEQMAEEPPAHRILAWRYLKPKPKKIDEATFAQQQGEIAGMMGKSPQKMPEHLKQMILRTEALVAKLNKNKK